MDARDRTLTVGAISVTLVLWASAFVAIRHLGGSVSPGALSLGRLLVATVVLGVMVLLVRRPRRWPTRRDLPLLLACGVMWFGVYNIALNAAEQRVDAGTAAMLVQIGPIIVALLAAVFLGEPLTRWLVVGALVGFAGVAVIGLAGSGHATGDLGGVALAVLAAVLYGAGVVTQKPLLARVPTLEMTFLACLVGTAVCLPWAGDLVTTLGSASGQTVALVAYLGAFPTALAFSTWGWALFRSNAGSLALTSFLVPVIATVLGWVFLGELPPSAAWLGAALCIVGVLLTRRRPRRRPDAVATPACGEEVRA